MANNSAAPISSRFVDKEIEGLNKHFIYTDMADVHEPQVGMIFGSPEEAYQYYCKYSCRLGFGITRRTSHNFHGIKYDATFSCNKCRKPLPSHEQQGFPLRSKGILRTGCKAHIILRNRMLLGSWEIEEVVLQHNHELKSDSVRLMRCHRELPLFVKRQLEINELAGLAQHKSITAVFTQAGGITRCQFSDKDMRNYISEIRRLNLKCSDAAAVNYFREQQLQCPNFFYHYDLDDEGRLKNVFWADARSRAAYKYFSDVITFDTTYLANRFRMPFAVFVGVNHHGHSILLGCALLANEFKDTYIWLFRTLLSCMHDKAPDAMVTDQCGAICGAIEAVFQHTCHRLCLWHILKKVPEKLVGCDQRDKVIQLISHAVYDSLTIAEFETPWLEILSKYQLGSHQEWFTHMYDIRHKWVPVFVKDKFWAGMSTTQRSESMNSFFDGYINSKTSLKSFVEKYNSALHSKWEKENIEYYKCAEFQPKLVSSFAFERQIADVYTHKMFYKFQKEVKLLMGCSSEFIEQHENVQTFSVSELSTKQQIAVHFCTVSHRYSCQCKQFEFKDFIRSHINQIVPPEPVLRDLEDYNQLYVHANQTIQELIEIASSDKSLCQLLFTRLHTLRQDLCEHMHSLPKHNPPTQSNDTNKLADDAILDPLIVRSKGRPCSNRFKPTFEKNAAKKKKGPNHKKTSQPHEPPLEMDIDSPTYSNFTTATDLLLHFQNMQSPANTL